MDFAHYFKGTSEKARLANVETSKITTRLMGESDIRMQTAPMVQQAVSAHVRNAAFAEFPGTPGPAPNLTETPWLYAHWEKLAPLERGRAEAEREVRGTGAAHAVATMQRDEARRRQGVLTQGAEVQRKELERFAATAGEQQRGDLAVKAEAYAKTLELLAQHTKELTSAEQAYTATALTAADARSAARKGEIGVMQEQLNLAKQNTQRAEVATVGIGMMQHRSTRAFALQAAEQAEKFGIENLSPDQLGLIRQAGGDRFLRRKAIESAEADPSYLKLRGILGAEGGEGGQGYKETAKREIDLNHQVQQKIDIDIKLQAEDLAKIISPQAVKDMEDAMKALLKEKIAEVNIADIVKNILGAGAKR